MCEERTNATRLRWVRLSIPSFLTPRTPLVGRLGFGYTHYVPEFIVPTTDEKKLASRNPLYHVGKVVVHAEHFARTIADIYNKQRTNQYM